ncbi:MAG: mechanosensitive ion channel domain-containing protein [Pseudomonadota bacterium]
MACAPAIAEANATGRPAEPGAARRLWRPTRGPFIAFLALVLCVLAFSGPAGAQDDGPDYEQLLGDLEREAVAIEGRISNEIEPDVIERMLQQLIDQRDRVPGYEVRLQERIEPLSRQLRALGPAPEEGQAEAEAVARERGALSTQLADLEGLALRLDQADARAIALIERLTDTRRRIFTERLLSRDESVFESGVFARGVHSLLTVMSQILAESRLRMEVGISAGQLAGRMIAPVGIAILGGIALIILRRRLLASLIPELRGEMSISRRVGIALLIMLSRLLLPALAVSLVLIGAHASGLLGTQGRALVEGLAATGLLTIVAFALSGAFFAPGLPQIRLSHLDERCVSRAHRLVIVLALIVGLQWALVVGGSGLEMPLEAITVVNLVLVCLGSIALWRFIAVIRTGDQEHDDLVEEDPDDADDADAPEKQGPGMLTLLVRGGSVALIIVAVIAPLLALAGYLAASRFILFNPLLTAGLVGCFVLAFSVVREIVERVAKPAEAEESTAATQRRSRLAMIPVILGSVLSIVAVPLIALIWGAEQGDLVTAWQAVRDGIDVGDITIAPLDFAAFVAIFALFYLIARIFQGVLSRSVLPLTGLDVGARSAITAGVGYVGFVIAALAAVAFVGVDLSNIAIVAGALSVGIGFGLQNVVNNFVSGLILLIERPIKAGDWVQLNSGMGYVQRINVRSTVIETFDRASLIVPNSEMVSSTVINWTHTNLNGRIIVAVKVAMGSDPREVERIMVQIARAHPMVLRRPQPYVLFRGYGDYAMNFEVRAVLRDVNWILNVQSDFYFEIHRRFGEAGIEIPIQRSDLALTGHVAGLPAADLGERPAPADEMAGAEPGTRPGAPEPHRPAPVANPRTVAAGMEGDADGGDGR